MKNFYLIIAVVLLNVHLLFGQQLCPPRGISTNPDSPVNPQQGVSNWLNTFDWMSLENGGEYLLNEMSPPFSFPKMTHPYSLDNMGQYAHLTNVAEMDLDMYFLDGWELFAVNLGYFPNGVPVVQNGIGVQALPEIPFVMLYNKRRSILRMFFNSRTGLVTGWENAQVTLEFVDPENNLTGLFRLGGGKDRALDQNTKGVRLSALVDHPNNPPLWMYCDFVMAYDPCSCNSSSGQSISLQFRFFNEADIKISGRGLSMDIDLANEQGLLPQDFLVNTQYNEDFQGTGAVIYKNMNSMLDQYLARLEEVEAYNNSLPSQEEIKFKKTVLKLLKTGAIAATGFVIDPTLAYDVSQFASNLILGTSGGIKISEAALEKSAKDILGFGFDYLEKEWVGETARKPSPTSPVATMTELAFEGQLVDESEVESSGFMVPGVYPDNLFSSNQLGVFNYPVFNEVLGTFALLETPKVDYLYDHHLLPWQDYQFYTTDYNNHIYYWRTYTRKEKLRLKLDSPLKFVINPITGLSLEDVEIKASFVLNTPSRELVTSTVEVQQGALFTHSLFPPYDYLINNLIGLTDIPEVNRMASPFVALNNFNDLVFEIEVNRMAWSIVDDWPNAAAPGEPSNLVQGLMVEMIHQSFLNEALYEAFDLTNEDLNLQLKLSVDFHYNDPEPSVVNQIFTYDIPVENFIVNNDLTSVPWSVTENPLNGQSSLQDYLSLQTTTWDNQLQLFYGNITASDIHVHALDSIRINGVHSMVSPISSVVFTAQEGISVAGDAQLIGDMVLKLDDFVQMTSTPTPIITTAYLSEFCSGNTLPSYQADVPSERIAARIPNDEDQPPLQHEEVFARLYPNPVQDVLHVNSNQDVLSYKVMDSFGKIVLMEENNNFEKNFIIDMTSLSKGYYIIRLNFNNESIANLPFVK